MADFKFKPGDRVAERPRVILNVAASTEGKQLFKRHNKQRYGTVTATNIRVNARAPSENRVGAVGRIAESCDHEQMRLCAINELAEATQSVFNGHAG